MENIQETGNVPENTQEQELSFNEQTQLAQKLFDAVKERNDYIEMQGGFDTFAVTSNIGNGRDMYSRYEKAVDEARKEFNEKVTGKEEFFKKLKSVNEIVLEKTISSMFKNEVNHERKMKPRKSLLSRILRR
ncbi:MAG: hypothetical protein KBC41_04375 [Candidatus Pacebacteria bacterium]|nr:hypothetical protein [Candidatus Paceibacterota bacterium]MBP9867280.1 hypothetical protein [Candidatus Paceibacterota bacterium]